jgi:hypothetical protein
VLVLIMERGRCAREHRVPAKAKPRGKAVAKARERSVRGAERIRWRCEASECMKALRLRKVDRTGASVMGPDSSPCKI